MTHALAKCPFCGKEPVEDKAHYYAEIYIYIICCKKCHCKMDSIDHDDLIKTWNTRA